MQVLNANAIDQKLRKLYGKNDPKGSKSQVVDKLYDTYKEQLSKPELTVTNLITAVRYIQKHNVAQKDYPKMLKKVHFAGGVALTHDDFAHIYDIVTKANGKGVSYQDAKKVITHYLNSIHDDVKSGAKVRLGRLGYFCLQHSNGRHYNNKYGHGHTDPHYYVSYHASAEFKRDVK